MDEAAAVVSDRTKSDPAGRLETGAANDQELDGQAPHKM
jgi:hypothetical protein